MQVRPGYHARGPDITDRFTLLHPCSALHAFANSTHMSVQSCYVVAMFQDNRAPIPAFPAGKLNPAIPRGFDWRARGRCIISAFVGTDNIQNRVAALKVKSRRYTGAYWRAQKGFTHTLAIRRVIVAVAVAVCVQQGNIVLAPVYKAG